jgi:hypothetical protein
MTEWQPIETAPREPQEPILVWCPKPYDDYDPPLLHGETLENGEMYSEIAMVSWAGDAMGWLLVNIEYADPPGEPTHWMPLPAPPKEP